MARLSAEEMFKNMIGRKDEEPQPAQETAAAPTAEKKKASTVQVTVRLRPEQHKQLKKEVNICTLMKNGLER